MTGQLRVTNDAGTATSVGVFKVSPKITGFSPASAVAGSSTVVTITGANLQASTGAPTVKVGAFTIPPASVVASSSTVIQFMVPLGSTTGKIAVVTVDGTGTSADTLLVIQPPKLTSLSP